MRKQLRYTLIAGLAVLILAALIRPPAADAAVLNPLNPWRFGAVNICIQDHSDHGTQWPTGSVASWYNQAADLNVYHDYAIFLGCDGFSHATRIDIYYSDLGGADDATCAKVSLDHDNGYVQDSGIIINWGQGAYNAGCWETFTNLAWAVSNAVGWIIGLADHHNGNRSVMSDTAWTQDNVGSPQASDFEAIERRYPW